LKGGTGLTSPMASVSEHTGGKKENVSMLAFLNSGAERGAKLAGGKGDGYRTKMG